MLLETERWPYDFPCSEDYLFADQRGRVSGRLLVREKYVNLSFYVLTLYCKYILDIGLILKLNN